MKKDFRLNLTDKQSYEAEIEHMMDDVLPVIEDYFKQYGAEINKFTYDSTYEFGAKTRIIFGVNAPGFYPSFSFDILPVEKSFRSPSQRFFRGTFVLRGIPDEKSQLIQKEFKESPVIIVDNDKSGNLSPKEKILDLFEKSKEVRENWYKYNLAADVFLF